MTGVRPWSDEIETTRFVVLRHVTRGDAHYDLMIDLGHALATWKTAQPPETAGDHGLACEQIADHRRAYLDYEGPISGDRGSVTQHDRGTCRIESSTEERWVVSFEGERLRGPHELVRGGQGESDWRLRALPPRGPRG